MYKITFSKQLDLLANHDRTPIQSIYTVKSKKNKDLIACARQGTSILGYKYDKNNGVWKYEWNVTLSKQRHEYPLDKYPWIIDNKILPDKNIIVLLHPKGIQFYNLNETKPGLDLLKEDSNFHSVFDFELVWGRFYPNEDWLGVMTRNSNGDVSFYAATKDSFDPKQPDPLFELSTKINLTSSWRSPVTKFFVTKLYKNETEVIGLCTNEGLKIYKFNGDYLLESVINVTQIIRTTKDHIFFGFITDGLFKNILHLNSSGLFLYKHNGKLNSYEFLHLNVDFSESDGWLSYYTSSIHLVDYNYDGRDDILFTGSQGLQALSFNSNISKWESLINPHELKGSQRFSTVINTAITDLGQPKNKDTLILFTQDAEGKLEWARVSKEVQINTPTTTLATTLTTKASVNPKRSSDKVEVPAEVERSFGTKKVSIRWAEQWDQSFLTEPVDVGSGKVKFNVPLIDTSIASGWGVKMTLSYTSEAIDSDFLGVGWTTHLADDYVLVNFQGSLLPEDIQYYFVINGNPQLLKLNRTVGVKRYFEYTDIGKELGDITIIYDSTKEQWTFEDAGEKMVYGKAADSKSKDALRWGLAWPNFRGIGREKSEQIPLINAWFLNYRFDKEKQQSLYYHYEIDNANIPGGKSYTSSVRLKSLRDDAEMEILFDFAKKAEVEYVPFEAVDNEGNIVFPIPLSHPKFLEGIRVITNLYSQQFKFQYMVEDKKRLLIAIKQIFPTRDEFILQFNYMTLSKKKLLKSCTLSFCNLTHSFSYETVLPPTPIFDKDNVLKYPVREPPMIAYGPDYAVMAYRDLNPSTGTIIFKILNRELTRILFFCLGVKNTPCPTADSEITNYNVMTYKSSFFIYTETEKERKVTIYNKNNRVWCIDPFVGIFSSASILEISETLFAEALNDHLRLISRENTNSNWTEVLLQTPERIRFMAVHNQHVITYNDNELSLHSRISSTKWKNKVLDKINGLASDLDNLLKSFNTTEERRQRVLENLMPYSLQIKKNFILISTLRIFFDGRIKSVGFLYSLNEEYHVRAKYPLEKDKSLFIEENTIRVPSGTNKENTMVLAYHYNNVLHKDTSLDWLLSVVFQPITNNLFGFVIPISDEVKLFNLEVEDIIGPFKSIHEKYEMIHNINKDPESQNFFRKLFNAKSLRFYLFFLSEFGVYYGEDTLFRFTGTTLKEETINKTIRTPLGNNFVLESERGNETLIKIYTQNSNHYKDKFVEEIKTSAPIQLVNRYPKYMAYHDNEHQLKVKTFKNDQTLGQTYHYTNEKLFGSSDWLNLITVVNATSKTSQHYEPVECWVRPVSTLVSNKEQIFVKQLLSTDGEQFRLTGFQRSFSTDSQRFIYTETVSVIPGDDEKSHGRYEVSKSYQTSTGNATTSQRWLNSKGKEIMGPPQKDHTEPKGQSSSDISNTTMIFDKNSDWLISDFSPFRLDFDEVAYYGFEQYEIEFVSTELGMKGKVKNWYAHNAQIIHNKFPFTGKSFLQLKGSPNSTSFLEKVFRPRHQDLIYLAACWVRCGNITKSDNTVPYLQAIISTSNGNNVVKSKGKVKHQLGDWSYLEIIIDLLNIKNFHKNRSYNSSTAINITEGNYTITLRVENNSSQTVDLDHIRFHPITLEFQANVYNSLTGKQTEVIQSNGLVSRTVYNRLQQKVASIKTDGLIGEFTSIGKPSILPHNSENLPNRKLSQLNMQPENCILENFDQNAWRNRWVVLNNATNAWNIASGQLWHVNSGVHKIQADNGLIDEESAAVRFYFILQTLNSSFTLTSQDLPRLEIKCIEKDSATLTVEHTKISKLPCAGELILMMEHKYIWVWMNGVLLIDQPLFRGIISPWSAFALSIQNKILIEDLLIMNRPQVQVTYFNGFGEKIQTVQLESSEAALVKESLYDQLGREAIISKTTRVHRQHNQPLLNYYKNFITNKNFTSKTSVWHTGKVQGEVDLLNPDDEGVPYQRTEFEANPLNEPKTLGLPGPDFSIHGNFSVKVFQNSDIAFLENLFPSSSGYRQKVVLLQNGSLHISVFNKHNLEVARYVRVPSFNHILSTYEYDKEHRLVKILPPLYHEKVNTDSKTSPWQSGEKHLSNDERKWQELFATCFTYDEKGNLVRKKSPDSGEKEFIYNSSGQMRFMIFKNATKQIEQVIYFEYETNGLLSKTGYLENPSESGITINDLHNKRYLKTSDLPKARKYQQFHYVDNHKDPFLRGLVKYCLLEDNGDTIAEKMIFDSNENVILKSTLTAKANPHYDSFTTLRKEYLNDNLVKLIYPVTVKGQSLEINHSYNKIGQLTGLGTSENPTLYASFTYLATGQLESETYQPGSTYSFTRKYEYNSPGYLKQISDRHLTEFISYSKNGLNEPGFGDGIVMETAYNASWSKYSDGRWFQVRENDIIGSFSSMCFRAFKKLGYINNFGKPVKFFAPKKETSMPLFCGGETARQIAKLLSEKQEPTYYGHKYAYGNHKELIKAKYFNEETKTLIQPLYSYSFSLEISNFTSTQSEDVWQLLISKDYLTVDQQNYDKTTAIGKRGKTIFKNIDLYEKLKNLNTDYTLYEPLIEKLVLESIAKRKSISVKEFENYFLSWQGLDLESSIVLYNKQKLVANVIGEMLSNQGFLPTETNLIGGLDTNFTKLLKQYSSVIPEIIKVLTKHFAYAIGETPFDVEYYNIDANGNHGLFYSGFDRYELIYRNGSNQVEEVKLNILREPGIESSFIVSHDNQGNIIRAMYKGIKHIEYHPVSQRALKVELENGCTLRFTYDAFGERKFKRVFDAKGNLTREIFYLRDEKGRVLLDHETRFLRGFAETTVTSYLYGPRGLLGFIRDDQFFSVFTDHSGSIRLVLLKGIVVAAYDYLPYGQLMRSYGSNPKVNIFYRYTGQEWDEETNLYNYHSRLYDPIIGRFYQVDPKEQYFSPYKYAGNSPLSLVDPDGEFAILLTLIIVGAILGAYLGAAAANNKWNPIEWDFSDAGTWSGMILGAVGGALLPVGFVGLGVAGSIAAVALGGVVAYLEAASVNDQWNPLQWNWTSPTTYNALFQGFATGSGFVRGIKELHQFAGDILTKSGRSLGKARALYYMFLVSSYSTGGGLALVGMAQANWDFTKPKLYSNMFSGLSSGVGWVQNFAAMGKGLTKLVNSIPHFTNTRSFFKELKIIEGLKSLKARLKDPENKFYKVISSLVCAFFSGVESNEHNKSLDFTKWKWNEFNTYQGIINGVFLGKSLSDIKSSMKNEQTNNKGSKEDFSSEIKNYEADVTERSRSLSEASEQIIENRWDSFLEIFNNLLRFPYEMLGLHVGEGLGYLSEIKRRFNELYNSYWETPVSEVVENYLETPVKASSQTSDLITDHDTNSHSVDHDTNSDSADHDTNSYSDRSHLSPYLSHAILLSSLMGGRLMKNLNTTIQSGNQTEVAKAFIENLTLLSSKLCLEEKNTTSMLLWKDIEFRKLCNSTKNKMFEYAWNNESDKFHSSNRIHSLFIKINESGVVGSSSKSYHDKYYHYSTPQSVYKNNLKEDLDLNTAFNLSKKKGRRIRSLKFNQVVEIAPEILTENNFMELSSIDKVHSGCDKPSFWPVSFISNIRNLVSPIFTHNWISDPIEDVKIEDCETNDVGMENFLSSRLPPLNPSENGPSMTEMGDTWLNNTDLNGLFTLSVWLSRKLCRYKPKMNVKKSQFFLEKSIDLDIKSTKIVDQFMNILIEIAETLGIEKNISNLIEDPNLYFNAVATTRKHLSTGEIDLIPKWLFVEFVKRRIQGGSTILSKTQIDDFSSNVANYCYELQQQLAKEELEWLPPNLRDSTKIDTHKKRKF